MPVSAQGSLRFLVPCVFSANGPLVFFVDLKLFVIAVNQLQQITRLPDVAIYSQICQGSVSALTTKQVHVIRSMNRDWSTCLFKNTPSVV